MLGLLVFLWRSNLFRIENSHLEPTAPLLPENFKYRERGKMWKAGVHEFCSRPSV
ncbi:hypothetical protein Desti_3272 [Desulfomonile tiedjei DSM 6799]|uniref:Uncharacterized protein n=1 Tax=Desulfomonile tiedjei (strain ATCC 49306 / DSM 6799 / DCB-1) TaxID=706587 RepID=I4C8N9_DESTA|nr:hypothetical protein Desti_3272 [Desulfomonile tiedjei DSM 6799]